MKMLVRSVCLLTAVLVVSICRAQSLALTFDDGPDMEESVALSASERNQAILSQLSSAHLKSVLFVTRIDADEARNALIRQWGAQGHGIGNHTASHPDFNNPKTTLAAFEEQLRLCDSAISSMPGYTKRFRFPYLNEGETAEKRDGFRAYLSEVGYKPAPVSIDASDWYYSNRLRERLKKNPGLDLKPYRAAYLHHLYDRALYYDGLSRTVLGRSAAHVILLHHNLINALFLGDVIKMFQSKGWKLIDVQAAYADSLYDMQPGTLPAGESILWALAKEKGVAGLRYPGEDDVYEKPILDRLHL